MIIKCLNGYFKFYEDKVGEISDLMRISDISLVSMGDYWTFSQLESCPEFSIEGVPYMGVIAKKNYEGKVEKVFSENGFVFDNRLGIIRNISDVSLQIELYEGKNKYISNGLIVPASITQSGQRVLGYTCHLRVNQPNFEYSEVDFV